MKPTKFFGQADPRWEANGGYIERGRWQRAEGRGPAAHCKRPGRTLTLIRLNDLFRRLLERLAALIGAGLPGRFDDAADK
jgi:hypothetical protein